MERVIDISDHIVFKNISVVSEEHFVRENVVENTR